jgi:hypothetical protein
MTPKFMASILEIFKATPFTVRDQYVRHCWIPGEMAESWAKAHKIKLEGKNSRGRPRGQRQDENKMDPQYVYLVARYRAEGHSEHEAVRMVVQDKHLDWEQYWIEQQRTKPRSREEIRSSLKVRIRKKFREGQRR